MFRVDSSPRTAAQGTAIDVGDVLLHVGLHKTGTTSLQETMAANRLTLKEHGVLYPGTAKFHHKPIVAFLGGSFGWEDRGDYRPPRSIWEEFLAEAGDFPDGRTIVSTEYLDDQPVEVAQRLVDEFPEPARVQIAVTVRSLARSLPSIWQQTLKAGSRSTFERYLHVMFGERELPQRDRFWRRYGAAAVVERWVAAVGPERVHVVVIPRGDHDHIFNAFAELLALPQDFFAGRVAVNDDANRSMSASEAEMMRRFNVLVAQRVDWPSYQRLVRYGAILRMVDSGPARDGGILAPEWALEQAGASDRSAAARLDELGVHILGRTSWLYEDPPPPGDQVPPAQVPIDSAVFALEGLIDRALTELDKQQAKVDKRLAAVEKQAQRQPEPGRRYLSRRGLRSMRRRVARPTPAPKDE
jgi:hypothetical protein